MKPAFHPYQNHPLLKLTTDKLAKAHGIGAPRRRDAYVSSRLLHALLCAYVKHQRDSGDIAWSELGDIMHNAICEAVGDKAYCAWMDKLNDDLEKEINLPPPY